MKIKYILVKDKKYKKYFNINFSNDFKVKNKKEYPGTINFYDEDLISKIIKIKIDNSFKKLLELLIKLEEDENPSDGYVLFLNESEKFRKETINKYRKYLKKEQIEFFNKKLELIEKDIKNKLLLMRVHMMRKNMIENNEFEEENVVSHHR